MQLIDVVRRCAPRARPEYLAAFEAGEAALAKAKVTTPLRLAHMLAQFAHETNGFRIVRESGNYSAKRIMEIFGVGKHSARVTEHEAKVLARNGPALFERVYGLGNPSKARELGNTRPGDGWAFRGNGLNQGTGRGFHRRASKLAGVDFEGRPDLASSAEYSLIFALAEWDAAFNAMADRNDIRGITKRLNGGYNGYDDRVRWFNKFWPLLRDAGKPAESWKAAKADPATRALQRDLNKLGYTLAVDGRFGPKTAAAVRDFQARNGLTTDAIPGPITREAIKTRLAAPGYASPPAITSADAPPDGAKPTAIGVGGNIVAEGLRNAAEAIQEQVSQLAPYADLVPIIKTGAAVLTAAATALILYGLWRQFASSIFAPRPAVPR